LRKEKLCTIAGGTYDGGMTTPKSGTSVSCPCGASLEIDPNETTQEISCPECGMILEVAIAIDSRTKKVRLGILVKPQSVTHRESKGKGNEIHTAKCVCGAQIHIESSGMSPDMVYICEACEAEYTATLKKPKSGGMSTLVLRPMIASPVTKAKPAPAKAPTTVPAKTPTAVPPPKAAPSTLQKIARTAPLPPPAKPAAKPVAKSPAPAPAGSAAALAAKERIIQMSKADIGAQDFAGGHLVCFCRAAITLKEGFPKEIVKCPECGTGFRIFQATNPKNGEQMAVMIPRE
jgi:DNA-directed RNA polymerase subunit RPC12/RpoP